MAIFWSLPQADDDGVLGVHEEPVCPLGSQYHDAETGYIWQYLKAGEDLSLGNALVSNLNLANFAVGAAVAAGEMEIPHAATNLLTTLARVKPKSKQKEMAMVQVVVTPGIGQRGVITEIYQNRLVIEWLTETGGLETALTAVSSVEIFADWLGLKSGNVDQATIGFVQQRNGVKQDEYFWALYCGKGTVRKTATNVIRGSAMTTAADGEVETVKTADGAANTARVCCTALVSESSGSAGNLFADIKAANLIGEVPVKTDVGYQASTIAPPASGSA